MTISFTTGQAVAAMDLLLVFAAMSRCALRDFDHPVSKSLGLGGAALITAALAVYINWSNI